MGSGSLQTAARGSSTEIIQAAATQQHRIACKGGLSVFWDR